MRCDAGTAGALGLGSWIKTVLSRGVYDRTRDPFWRMVGVGGPWHRQRRVGGRRIGCFWSIDPRPWFSFPPRLPSLPETGQICLVSDALANAWLTPQNSSTFVLADLGFSITKDCNILKYVVIFCNIF